MRNSAIYWASGLVLITAFLGGGNVRPSPGMAEEEQPKTPAAQYSFPRIAGYGGVAEIESAAEPPRAHVRVVFDITTEAPPGDVNKGIETVARYLNLHAQAGHRSEDAQLALVLHGGATRAALTDEAFSRRFGVAKNPSRELLALLRGAGVEVYVCGQSLARNQFPAGEVSAECRVAASAMTVNVNKQLDGYAYLAIH